MNNEKRLPEKEEKAKLLVFNKVRGLLENPNHLSLENVKIVWFSKTLKNWKALVITTLPDEHYYEVTYNGEKEETYIDTYTKIDNLRVTDKEYFETFFGNGVQR